MIADSHYPIVSLAHQIKEQIPFKGDYLEARYSSEAFVHK